MVFLIALRYIGYPYVFPYVLDVCKNENPSLSSRSLRTRGDSRKKTLCRRGQPLRLPCGPAPKVGARPPKRTTSTTTRLADTPVGGVPAAAAPELDQLGFAVGAGLVGVGAVVQNGRKNKVALGRRRESGSGSGSKRAHVFGHYL